MEDEIYWLRLEIAGLKGLPTGDEFMSLQIKSRIESLEQEIEQLILKQATDIRKAAEDSQKFTSEDFAFRITATA